MERLFVLFFILSTGLIFADSVSAGEDPFALVIVEGKPLPPKYLFHWDSFSGIQRIASQAKSPRSPLPLRPMVAGLENSDRVLDDFPGLAGKSSIFAWSHPTAAMAVSVTGDPDMPGEIYARTSGGHPPSLITMTVKHDAKMMVIRSDGLGPKYPAFDGVDLVLHIKDDGYGLVFREWIILNPNVIEKFTADPRELPEEVLAEMKNSTQPGAILKPGEEFIMKNLTDEPLSAAMVKRAQSPEYRGRLVKMYLESKEPIPPFFARNLVDCPGLLIKSP